MSQQMRGLSILVLCCIFFIKTDGFRSGAPSRTCSNLSPHHEGATPQTSYSPYRILPTAGQGRIRLILGSPEGLAYKGFLIVARDVDTGEYVGEFNNLPDSAKPVECVSGTKNGVTHSDSRDKQNIDFEWESPPDYEGTFIFNSTFVSNYVTYWVGVKSPRITVSKHSITIETSPTPISTPRMTTEPYYTPTTEYETKEDDPFYDGCSSSKNCFGEPKGCVETKNCMAVVAVVVRGDRYLFELQSRGAKYIAVGLSEDTKMGDDSVVECVNEDNGGVKLYTSWNAGKTNSRQKLQEGSVQLEGSSLRDDVISCRFWRDKRTVIQNYEFDLVNKAYHLLLAAGSSLRNNGVEYHDLVFVSTAEPKLLSDVGNFAAASDLLIRLHGALMIASWIGTASIGILLARYYKDTWTSSKICGKDHWFAWHRFFMILTWLMTLAAFIIIFVELGEWSSETIHASLGLATTILCFVQPFMAAIRPHPGSPKRALFNWSHWFVGNAAQICGIIAIFFAVRLNKAKLPEWVDWILVAYVAFHVFVHVVLSFMSCISDKQAVQRVNSFPMKDLHSRASMIHPEPKRDAPNSSARRFFFGIYFIGIAIIVAVLIIITVLAPIEETWRSLVDSTN